MTTQTKETIEKDRARGIVMIAIAAVLISIGPLFARLIETADAWHMSLYRPGTIGLIVGFFLILHYRGQTVQKFMAIGPWGWIASVAMATTGATFIQAITTTTVANTLFLMAAIPFFTAIFAWIVLKETLDKITLVTMAIAALGIIVMIGEGLVTGLGGGSLYGNFMALATAIIFAVYAIIVRMHREVDLLPVVVLSSLMLAGVAALVRIDDLVITWWDLLMCALWGGVFSGLGYCLFVIAARYLKAAEVTFFLTLEFALGPFWVWAFLGETPSIWSLIGGAAILIAVVYKGAAELRANGSQPS